MVGGLNCFMWQYHPEHISSCIENILIFLKVKYHNIIVSNVICVTTLGRQA